jgi:hypothetical protein
MNISIKKSCDCLFCSGVILKQVNKYFKLSQIKLLKLAETSELMILLNIPNVKCELRPQDEMSIWLGDLRTTKASYYHSDIIDQFVLDQSNQVSLNKEARQTLQTILKIFNESSIPQFTLLDWIPIQFQFKSNNYDDLIHSIEIKKILKIKSEQLV